MVNRQMPLVGFMNWYRLFTKYIIDCIQLILVPLSEMLTPKIAYIDLSAASLLQY